MTTKQLGRPTKFTDELAREVALQHATGSTFETIAQAKHMPDAATLYRWQAAKRGRFCEYLAQARIAKAAFHASKGEELLNLDLTQVEPKLASATVGLVGKQSAYQQWLAERVDPRNWGRVAGLEEAAATLLVAFTGLALPVQVQAEVTGEQQEE